MRPNYNSEYSRQNPRRSIRSRSPIVRYGNEPEFQQRRRPSQARKRNVVRHNLNNQLASFEENLCRRTFITGCFRIITIEELNAVCYYVVTARELEIDLYTRIQNAIPDAATKNVFGGVIANLAREMVIHDDDRDPCSNLFCRNNEMVDISVYIVYFWRMISDVLLRINDVIKYSRSRLLPRTYDQILNHFNLESKAFKQRFSSYIDGLRLTGDSWKYYNKYKNEK